MNSPKGPRRAGPVRARALAQKDIRDIAVSSTAWLNGAHEAIALHPEWLQLRAHLKGLTKDAVQDHIDAEDNLHPHAIEAIRQVTGDLLEGCDLLPGTANPHLLHEPYMSVAGAAGLRSQTVVDLAREVDMEAEAHHTLDSLEYLAFHNLVRSIYVGSLQKRADHIENRNTTSNRQSPQARPPCSTVSSTLPSSPIQRRAGDHRAGFRNTTSEKSTRETDVSGRGSDVAKPGVAPSSYQACSGDIAQALVAIAAGDGFDIFCSAGDDGNTPSSAENSELKEFSAREVIGKSGRNATGFARGGVVGGDVTRTLSNVHDETWDGILRNRRSKAELLGEAALSYLLEETTVVSKKTGTTATPSIASPPLGSANSQRNDTRTGGGGGRTRIPGLDWLAPHIVGRSIPMTLRQEIWRRTLSEQGPSASEVGRMLTRIAGEKGIVDPTNTPIAGMVATGVRHRAAEAFPWLARGGQAELELRKRACREAERLLNQYFVFVGRHEARHVAMSLVLAYVFDRGEGMSARASRSAGAGGEAGGGLVAMLHSLSSTGFAPGIADLRSDFRNRAYEEIRRRDGPLFDHLSAVFPGGRGDGSHPPRGLVEVWLEDALVGYLREDALLFVWDHLFLLGWAEQLPLFVADVAIHLRTTILRATAPLTLMSLARDACRRICTRDLREAFRRRHAGSV